MSPYLLGIDSGNTSTKAVVFDEAGFERGVGSVNNAQMNPQPRWVEQDMYDVWENVQTVVKEALLAARIEGKDISAIGVSGHGDGMYLVDENGEPVRAGIKSMDSRAHEVVERMSESGVSDEALRFSGQQPVAAQSVSLLVWFKENQPEVLERTR